MRVDLLYHYLSGQILHKGFDILGLGITDNALASGAVMVGKELTDASFDWLDLAFSIVGWIVML
jgi:hypothetical protein